MGNYVQRAQDDLRELLPDCEPELIRLYSLLALSNFPEEISTQDVHNAWAVWANRATINHPALVPFWELTFTVQRTYQAYRNAIREASSRVDRKVPPPY